MNSLSLYPQYRKRVRIIDIDGTLFEKKAPEFYHEARALPFAAKMVRFWYEEGDYILLWTARVKELEEFTRNQLKEAGIPFHELLMEKPWSHEIHIYDDWAPVSHKIDREHGLGEMLRLAYDYREGLAVEKILDEQDQEWFNEMLEALYESEERDQTIFPEKIYDDD